jgi:hypothetical protein
MSLEKIDEVLGTEVCNTRIQPLQHMQHPDLLLQHLRKTLAKHTSETSKTLETYGCNMRFSAHCHLAAWTNGRLSLRSSTPARRLVAAHRAR